MERTKLEYCTICYCQIFAAITMERQHFEDQLGRCAGIWQVSTLERMTLKMLYTNTTRHVNSVKSHERHLYAQHILSVRTTSYIHKSIQVQTHHPHRTTKPKKPPRTRARTPHRVRLPSCLLRRARRARRALLHGRAARRAVILRDRFLSCGTLRCRCSLHPAVSLPFLLKARERCV